MKHEAERKRFKCTLGGTVIWSRDIHALAWRKITHACWYTNSYYVIDDRYANVRKAIRDGHDIEVSAPCGKITFVCVDKLDNYIYTKYPNTNTLHILQKYEFKVGDSVALRDTGKIFKVLEVDRADIKITDIGWKYARKFTKVVATHKFKVGDIVNLCGVPYLKVKVTDQYVKDGNVVYSLECRAVDVPEYMIEQYEFKVGDTVVHDDGSVYTVSWVGHTIGTVGVYNGTPCGKVYHKDYLTLLDQTIPEPKFKVGDVSPRGEVLEVVKYYQSFEYTVRAPSGELLTVKENQLFGYFMVGEQVAFKVKAYQYVEVTKVRTGLKGKTLYDLSDGSKNIPEILLIRYTEPKFKVYDLVTYTKDTTFKLSTITVIYSDRNGKIQYAMHNGDIDISGDDISDVDTCSVKTGDRIEIDNILGTYTVDDVRYSKARGTYLIQCGQFEIPEKNVRKVDDDC